MYIKNNNYFPATLILLSLSLYALTPKVGLSGVYFYVSDIILFGLLLLTLRRNMTINVYYFPLLFVLSLFIIIIVQALLFTNNNQKTSFKYFKWTVKEVSIGKLISISFFSGLFISTLLNSTITSNKKNIIENIEENYESSNNEEDMKSNIEMPPQRDIRDSQPTISVNYRVVKNTEGNDFKKDLNYSNPDDKDDWDNADNDW